MCIGLKFYNECFDFENVKAHRKYKDRNKFFPERIIFYAEITRRYYSALRRIKRCKTWKLQRMKDQLRQNTAFEAADAQFLSTEGIFFRDTTKEGNDEMADLENLNHENESDRWHR